MPLSGVTINPECVSSFNDLKLGKSGKKYIIFKLSDSQKEVVVDEVGSEPDYDVFREKLINAPDGKGKIRPSWAVYDLTFELEGGEGKRSKLCFITYIDDYTTAMKNRMVYASSTESLKNALNGIAMHWQANDTGMLEYADLIKEASKGKSR